MQVPELPLPISCRALLRHVCPARLGTFVDASDLLEAPPRGPNQRRHHENPTCLPRFAHAGRHGPRGCIHVQQRHDHGREPSPRTTPQGGDCGPGTRAGSDRGSGSSTALPSPGGLCSGTPPPPGGGLCRSSIPSRLRASLPAPEHGATGHAVGEAARAPACRPGARHTTGSRRQRGSDHVSGPRRRPCRRGATRALIHNHKHARGRSRKTSASFVSWAQVFGGTSGGSGTSMEPTVPFPRRPPYTRSLVPSGAAHWHGS